MSPRVKRTRLRLPSLFIAPGKVEKAREVIQRDATAPYNVAMRELLMQVGHSTSTPERCPTCTRLVKPDIHWLRAPHVKLLWRISVTHEMRPFKLDEFIRKVYSDKKFAPSGSEILEDLGLLTKDEMFIGCDEWPGCKGGVDHYGDPAPCEPAYLDGHPWRKGVYRMTALGRQFLDDRAMVPAGVLYYDRKPVEIDGEIVMTPETVPRSAVVDADDYGYWDKPEDDEDPPADPDPDDDPPKPETDGPWGPWGAPWSMLYDPEPMSDTEVSVLGTSS